MTKARESQHFYNGMLEKVESGKAYYGEWLPIESAPRDNEKVIVRGYVQETSHKYFEIACKRIEDAQRQGDMLI